MRVPGPENIRKMLSDICTNSGADVGFDKLTFSINGSDDSVKAAMMVIQQIPFVQRAQYQIRVKVELANEHKEFVSGKKNGKINKIMGQSGFRGCECHIKPADPLQAMSKSFSMATTSTTSTSMFVAPSTRRPRTAWIWWNRRCLHQYRSMSRISTTSASLALVASISSAS